MKNNAKSKIIMLCRDRRDALRILPIRSRGVMIIEDVHLFEDILEFLKNQKMLKAADEYAGKNK